MKKNVPGECKRAYRSLLSAIASLAEAGVEVTADGLTKILQGRYDEETASLQANAAFGYLPSLSSKKLKNRVHWLVRSGYLALVYAAEAEDYFLALTAKGEENLIPLQAKKRASSKELTIRAISKGE
jgi:uncharacterized FlgJ-related protein